MSLDLRKFDDVVVDVLGPQLGNRFLGLQLEPLDEVEQEEAGRMLETRWSEAVKRLPPVAARFPNGSVEEVHCVIIDKLDDGTTFVTDEDSGVYRCCIGEDGLPELEPLFPPHRH